MIDPSMHDSWQAQARTVVRLAAWLHLPVACAIGLVVWVSHARGIPFERFCRDLFAQAGVPLYTALLSNVGAFLWSATAGLCLGAAWAMRGLTDRSDTAFLTGFGLLSAVLAFDDFFMLHDRLMPDKLILPETLAYAIYALVCATGLVVFWSKIAKTDWLLLAVALAFFSVSLLFDLLHQPGTKREHLIEDGAKLLGIVTWLAYAVRTCRVIVRRARRPETR